MLIEGCLQVAVFHSNHWIQGDTGQYFHFSEADFHECIGTKYWCKEKFDVGEKSLAALVDRCSHLVIEQKDDSKSTWDVCL